MSQRDPFDLIGKHVERTTPEGWTERGVIKRVLPDGSVIVELGKGRTIVVNPSEDTEWALVEAA